MSANEVAASRVSNRHVQHVWRSESVKEMCHHLLTVPVATAVVKLLSSRRSMAPPLQSSRRGAALVRGHRRFRPGIRGEFREGEFRGGCKTVTIRERRGDTVVVKRIKRC